MRRSHRARSSSITSGASLNIAHIFVMRRERMGRIEHGFRDAAMQQSGQTQGRCHDIVSRQLPCAAVAGKTLPVIRAFRQQRRMSSAGISDFSWSGLAPRPEAQTDGRNDSFTPCAAILRACCPSRSGSGGWEIDSFPPLAEKHPARGGAGQRKHPGENEDQLRDPPRHGRGSVIACDAADAGRPVTGTGLPQTAPQDQAARVSVDEKNIA